MPGVQREALPKKTEESLESSVQRDTVRSGGVCLCSHSPSHSGLELGLRRRGSGGLGEVQVARLKAREVH